MTHLKHVGVLGMKWGRRKDSSASDSPDHTRTRILKKKKTSQLSTDELRDLTQRLQLERQFKDLSKTQITRGQKILRAILLSVGKKLASSYIRNQGYGNISNVIDVIPTSVVD